jgi:BlaI family penicillinase repressor
MRTSSKPKTFRLGDLQLKIMKVLWERPEATIAQVHEALPPGHDLAYTTVATMLRKMEQRGLVAHRNDGRVFVYRAVAASEDVTRSMANHLVDRLFEGSLADMVSHLLTTREISPDELRQLEKLIAEKKRGGT